MKPRQLKGLKAPKSGDWRTWFWGYLRIDTAEHRQTVKKVLKAAYDRGEVVTSSRCEDPTRLMIYNRPPRLEDYGE